MNTIRHDSYGEDGTLVFYTIERYTESCDYRVKEYHVYCPYRNKRGEVEGDTFLRRWENNRGQSEDFIWDIEGNCVKTYNSYASLYIKGVRYYTYQSYLTALKE